MLGFRSSLLLAVVVIFQVGLTQGALGLEPIGLEISTTLGPIEGLSLKDDKVRGFLGIPYAQVPIENRRFELPIPSEPWSELRKTKHWSKKCLSFHRHFASLENYGEDCLYLSLLVPKEPLKTNLLVFFSNENLNVIRFLDLMKKEVAIAVVHFREGLQGYASLDPESGSYGIADIKLALDFINKNAKNFGITEKIILIAENDGASAVHLAFDSWFKKVDSDHEYQLVLLNGHKNVERFEPDFVRTTKSTRAFLEALGCSVGSGFEEAWRCAKAKSYTDVFKAYQTLSIPEEFGAPFRPNLANANLISAVPMILGFEETITSNYYHTVDEFNVKYNFTDFQQLLANVIAEDQVANAALIRQLLWHEYVQAVGDKDDTYFLWQQGRQILLDKTYIAPTTAFLRSWKTFKPSPDLFLFKYTVPNPITTCLSPAIPEFQQPFCNQWHKFLLRFAVKGAPTQKGCEPGKAKWPALYSSKRDYYITLDEDGKLEWDHNFGLRADAFWNHLVPMIERLEITTDPEDTNGIEISNLMKNEKSFKDEF